MGAAIQLSKQLIPNPFCLGGQKTHPDCGPQGLGFTTPKLFAHIERLAHGFPCSYHDITLKQLTTVNVEQIDTHTDISQLFCRWILDRAAPTLVEQ